MPEKSSVLDFHSHPSPPTSTSTKHRGGGDKRFLLRRPRKDLSRLDADLLCREFEPRDILSPPQHKQQPANTIPKKSHQNNIGLLLSIPTGEYFYTAHSLPTFTFSLNPPRKPVFT
jgi:hypothetical protein